MGIKKHSIEIKISNWDAKLSLFVAIVVFILSGCVGMALCKKVPNNDMKIALSVLSWLASGIPASIAGWVTDVNTGSTAEFPMPLSRKVRIVKQGGYILQCRIFGKWYAAVTCNDERDEFEICAELINAYRDMRQSKTTRTGTEVIYSGRL